MINFPARWKGTTVVNDGFPVGFVLVQILSQEDGNPHDAGYLMLHLNQTRHLINVHRNDCNN